MVSLMQHQIATLRAGPIVLLMTVFRLVLRRRRLWLDDAYAFPSALCLIVNIAGVVIHTHNPAVVAQPTKVASYYIMAVTFYGVIWFAHLSILFSIIKIDHNPKFLHATPVAFLVCGSVMIGQLFWVCEPIGYKWKFAAAPQCPVGFQVVICKIIFDVIADLILLIAPLKLFRILTDRSLRRRLMIVFSTCITTTIVSLAHAAYILVNGRIQELISAFVEICVSLAVCNVPILVSMIFPLRPSLSTQLSSLRFQSLERRTRPLLESLAGNTIVREPHGTLLYGL